MSSMYSRTQMPSPFRGTPASPQLGTHALPAAFTGAVDVLVQALLVAAPQHVHHGAVDPLRPQAAAEGQNEGAIVQPQLPPGLRLIDAEKIGPQGIAGDHHLGVGGEVFPRRLVGDEDGGVFCQHLDRHAGEGVGFMHHHRDPHFGRFAQDRPADIAAGADGDIRPEIPEDFRGGGAGCDRVDGGGQVAPYVLH